MLTKANSHSTAGISSTLWKWTPAQLKQSNSGFKTLIIWTLFLWKFQLAIKIIVFISEMEYQALGSNLIWKVWII